MPFDPADPSTWPLWLKVSEICSRPGYRGPYPGTRALWWREVYAGLDPCTDDVQSAPGGLAGGGRPKGHPLPLRTEAPAGFADRAGASEGPAKSNRRPM